MHGDAVFLRVYSRASAVFAVGGESTDARSLPGHKHLWDVRLALAHHCEYRVSEQGRALQAGGLVFCPSNNCHGKGLR